MGGQVCVAAGCVARRLCGCCMLPGWDVRACRLSGKPRVKRVKRSALVLKAGASCNLSCAEGQLHAATSPASKAVASRNISPAAGLGGLLPDGRQPAAHALQRLPERGDDGSNRSGAGCFPVRCALCASWMWAAVGRSWRGHWIRGWLRFRQSLPSWSGCAVLPLPFLNSPGRRLLVGGRLASHPQGRTSCLLCTCAWSHRPSSLYPPLHTPPGAMGTSRSCLFTAHPLSHVLNVVNSCCRCHGHQPQQHEPAAGAASGGGAALAPGAVFTGTPVLNHAGKLSAEPAVCWGQGGGAALEPGACWWLGRYAHPSLACK